MLPTLTATFLDFSIRSDFKKITILYIQGGIRRRITLVYDNMMRSYNVSRSMDINSATKLHIDYTKDQAYFLSHYELDFMSYDKAFEIYAPYTSTLMMNEVYASQARLSYLSKNNKILVIDYGKNL